MVGCGVALNEALDVRKHRPHLRCMAVTQQPQIDVACVDRVDPGHDGNRRRRSDTHEAMQPARKADRLVIVRYVEGGPCGKHTINGGEILELRINVGAARKT